MSKSTVGVTGFTSPSLNQGESFQSKDSRFRNNEKIRRVAAIDIGTNSTHLVIASVDPSLHTFSIDLAEKATTRLGNRDKDNGELTFRAKTRVFEALKRFKELAISHRVDDILLAATSAVREAPNGREFLIQIKEELALTVELISGIEEARLIYLGVLSGMTFGKQPHILIDIGGGSTELILADDQDARALSSTRIGAVSLQRDFVRHGSLSISRLNFLKTFIQGSLEPAVNKISSRLKSKESAVLVATSGTALSIGALAASQEQDFVLRKHGYKISKEKLDDLIEKLLGMTIEQRRKLPCLSDRRAEIIIPGALIMQKAMQMLDIEEVVLSERALREGLVVDWMLRRGLLKDRYSLQGSIRKRTVIHQVERFSVNRERSARIANNALSIYENTQGSLHNDSGIGKDLLWAAAMLHLCGQHINLSSYHKHSWYLIRHCELLGYSQAEHLMVAAIARYHRKSLPKKKHDVWQLLENKEDRKIVSEMSLILRLASAMDKRPESVISSLKVKQSSLEIIFELTPKKESDTLDLESWSLNNCSSIVKELTGFELLVIIKTPIA
ncbi:MULTISPECIES: Ppx/GppA phosphatase family protein [unclassified Prochlorococcus]|uniref:Ppx/GppA phosphatase family protein n=1 Tax=unclassified Prochlorococcus TaxID=2627481 RepID=UPI000533AC94|nr:MULTISPECIES: Ppx/GppA phosphatase family protein [unclassified Prochlorococcus]KGG16501.1 Exopolyphosphatasee [Prochlorococcus sp. MIT 0602]KGG17024.1 Exopolyphosphatasee [Prochlorococcus sp. MIT 0603]